MDPIVLPALCRRHGVFPFYPPLWGDGAIYIGNKAGCPVCHNPSPILSGTYREIDNTYRVIEDGNFTAEEIRQILSLIEKARRENLTQDQIKEEAAKVSPKIASFFDIANWSDMAKATLLTAVLGSLTALGVAAMARNGGPQPATTNNIFITNVVREIQAPATYQVAPPVSEKPPLRPRPRPKPRQ